MSSGSSSSVNQIPGSYAGIDVQDQGSDYGYTLMSYSEDEIANFDLDSPEYRALLVPPNYSWTPTPSTLTEDPQDFQLRPQQPPLRHSLPSYPGVHHQRIAGIPVSSIDRSNFNWHGKDGPIQPQSPFTSPAFGIRPGPITVPIAPTLYGQPPIQIPYLPGHHTRELGKSHNIMSNRAFQVGSKIRPEMNLIERNYRDAISGRSQRASGPLDPSQISAPHLRELGPQDVAQEERRSVPALQTLEWRFATPPTTEPQPESAPSLATTSRSTSASNSSGSASEACSSPPTSPDVPPPSSSIHFPSPASAASLPSPQSLKRKHEEDDSIPSSSKPVKKAKHTAEKSGRAAKPGKKRVVYEHHPYNPSAPRSPQMWNICTGQKEDRESWGDRVRDDSNNYFVHTSPFTQRFRLSPSATLGTPSPSSVAEAPERPDLFRFSATSSVTLNLFGGYYLKENPTHKPTKQDLQALFDCLSETEKKVWAERRQQKLASRKAATA